jgi:hypothetical protein
MNLGLLTWKSEPIVIMTSARRDSRCSEGLQRDSKKRNLAKAEQSTIAQRVRSLIHDDLDEVVNAALDVVVLTAPSNHFNHRRERN